MSWLAIWCSNPEPFSRSNPECDVVPIGLLSRHSNASQRPFRQITGEIRCLIESHRGLSPLPKKTNSHGDHNHDYYDLNEKLNGHFAASLTMPNCPAEPSQRPNTLAGEGIGPKTKWLC
jgi:hypothetical protein